MASTQKVPHTCWICGNSVQLETCKIDKHGLPVHERCHVLKLGLHKGATSERPNLERPPTAKRMGD